MRQLGVTRPGLSARETGDLIAFLYSVDYFGPSGNVAEGQRLLAEKKCLVCHQVAGAGGLIGPSLDFFWQHGSPLSVAAALWNHGPAMAQQFRTSGIGRPTVTESDLGAMIAYLRSLSRDPADAPLRLLAGRVDVGQRLFKTKRCADCHGEPGSGEGRALAGRGVPRSLTRFAAAMWNKEPAMLESMKRRPMPLPPLDADEMADLIAYLGAVRYFASPGDPRRGALTLGDKGCLGCHTVSVRDLTAPRNLALAKGLDSPAAIISALWNHVLVKAPSGTPEAWSPYRPEEMTDLMAWLGSLGTDAVTPGSER
jgi:mono/diheme cytochrome c family protein